MKTRFLARNRKSIGMRILAASIVSVGMITPAMGADTNPVTPINLVAPSGLPGIPALPFTGVKSAPFATTQTMLTLGVTPDQGVLGQDITISGKGLPVNTTMMLTWSTADGTWVADIQPNSVNYLGTKYTKYNVDMGSVTTDATGLFTFKTKAPSDFGGVKDIYAVKDGVAIAHGGFQLTRTVSISPKSGPIGTPITVTYTGMGASLYTAGGAVHWDSSYAGEVQALWTRGEGKVVIRAAGPVGNHFVEVKDAITFAYLNILQSPVPYANGGIATFRVTKDNGPPPASMTWPAQVEPTVTQRTTLSSIGLDPNTKAVATATPASGPINTKTTLNVTGLTTTGVHQIVWATVVGNRVNCTGTCWVYNSLPLGSATVTSGTIKADVTIPDHLGGWHVIQVKQGDVIEAQVSFYVKQSIVPFLDKSGKVIGMGLAKADNSGTEAAFARGGAASTPSIKYKAGEEITISIKGVGWTQFDNTLGVTYDNSYVGYGCGFNSNGYMVIHIRATGAPGTHIIDLHPLIYTQQPSFANAPYGMVPVLSFDRDFAALALGYQIPAYHFAITIVK
ncbi:MAG: hypothetical protein H7227_00090 [Actinobacteria bacterium]|nr:hypothetical protein [Actinomycetota bacterium]